MSALRRHVVFAVLLSTVAAAVADMQPPTLEETTAFIATAVRQHHARVVLRGDDVRDWHTETEFARCSLEQKTSLEVHVLRTWKRKTSVARLRLMDIDPARVQVVAQSAAGKPTFHVTVPCDGAQPCVGVGPSRENHLLLEFRSELMAERVAAALRHSSSLCEGTP